MNCVNGKCEKIRCKGKAECGLLFQCDKKGYCRPEKCFSNYECGAFGKCVEGSCYPKSPKGVDPSKLCTSDIDCIFSNNEQGRCLKVTTFYPNVP